MDKPRGFIYIDDLAHRFNGWDNTMVAVRNGAKKIKDATLLSSGVGEAESKPDACEGCSDWDEAEGKCGLSQCKYYVPQEAW